MRQISAAIVLIGLYGSSAFAEDAGSRAGHGHVTLSFQAIHVDGFESSVGRLPIGTVDTQSFNFEIDYYLTNRLSISAGIPFVRKRYEGSVPHDPLNLNPPRPEVENVDTGAWNRGFQDFHLGVRYRLTDGPFVVEPYAFLGIPSEDYPFFGHAAVGQGLLKFDVGSSISWFPGLSDAYYQVNVGYVFVEETMNTSVSHWLIGAQAGYFFNDTIAGRLFTQLKRGRGLTFPDDFPPPRVDERWYQHDRLVKHNYLNVGVGLDWSINSRYRLETAILTMVWAEQVHKMEYAVSVALHRSF
ncbi:MAG: hypothetical protein AAFN50_05425 [Pseudomonadota bacterium]